MWKCFIYGQQASPRNRLGFLVHYHPIKDPFGEETFQWIQSRHPEAKYKEVYESDFLRVVLSLAQLKLKWIAKVRIENESMVSAIWVFKQDLVQGRPHILKIRTDLNNFELKSYDYRSQPLQWLGPTKQKSSQCLPRRSLLWASKASPSLLKASKDAGRNWIRETSSSSCTWWGQEG